MIKMVEAAKQQSKKYPGFLLLGLIYRKNSEDIKEIVPFSLAHEVRNHRGEFGSRLTKVMEMAGWAIYFLLYLCNFSRGDLHYF